MYLILNNQIDKVLVLYKINIMKLPNKINTKSNGFTLIELLIVISIIGILAAVLIAVINPAAQQAKARDAGIKASIGKAVLVINAHFSAYAEYPYCRTLQNDLLNVTTTTCTSDTDTDFVFSLTGINLPATCGTNGFAQAGTTQCQFHYVRNGSSTYLSAKTWGNEARYFCWNVGTTGGTVMIDDTETCASPLPL